MYHSPLHKCKIGGRYLDPIEIPQEALDAACAVRDQFPGLTDSEIVIELLKRGVEAQKRGDKGMAAYALRDEVLGLQLDLERAETILRVLAEGYFSKYDTHTEEGRLFIIYEYERVGIFAEVVSDYLFKIRMALEELDKLAQAGGKT